MLTKGAALFELDELLNTGNKPTVDWLINLVKRTSGEVFFALGDVMLLSSRQNHHVYINRF